MPDVNRDNATCKVFINLKEDSMKRTAVPVAEEDIYKYITETPSVSDTEMDPLSQGEEAIDRSFMASTLPRNGLEITDSTQEHPSQRGEESSDLVWMVLDVFHLQDVTKFFIKNLPRAVALLVDQMLDIAVITDLWQEKNIDENVYEPWTDAINPEGDPYGYPKNVLQTISKLMLTCILLSNIVATLNAAFDKVQLAHPIFHLLGAGCLVEISKVLYGVKVDLPELKHVMVVRKISNVFLESLPCMILQYCAIMVTQTGISWQNSDSKGLTWISIFSSSFLFTWGILSYLRNAFKYSYFQSAFLIILVWSSFVLRIVPLLWAIDITMVRKKGQLPLDCPYKDYDWVLISVILILRSIVGSFVLYTFGERSRASLFRAIIFGPLSVLLPIELFSQSNFFAYGVWIFHLLTSSVLPLLLVPPTKYGRNWKKDPINGKERHTRFYFFKACIMEHDYGDIYGTLVYILIWIVLVGVISIIILATGRIVKRPTTFPEISKRAQIIKDMVNECEMEKSTTFPDTSKRFMEKKREMEKSKGTIFE